MFSHTTEGDDGRRYGSREEALVGRHLWDLKTASVVADFMVHPVVAGLEVDYLVMLGSNSPSPRSVILLEYDGLGEARPHDLAPRLDRFSRLALLGIESRWIIEPTFEAVERALTSYRAPHFLSKRMRCRCGRTEKITVIAHKECNQSEIEIESLFTCISCTSGLQP